MNPASSCYNARCDRSGSALRERERQEEKSVAERKIKLVRPGDEQTTWRGAGMSTACWRPGKILPATTSSWKRLCLREAGPAPHIQTREEEAFYVLEGEVVFRAAGERIVAQTGAYLNIPRDVPHYFKNESDATARMLIFFAPAGLRGCSTRWPPTRTTTRPRAKSLVLSSWMKLDGNSD